MLANFRVGWRVSIGALVELAADTDGEIVVADGGSRDATISVAKAAGARVIASLWGRTVDDYARGVHERAGVLERHIHVASS